MEKLEIGGKFIVKHYRANNLIGTYEFKNGVVNEGLDAILDIMFHADTQITTWYVGLVDNASYTLFAASDTMASHAGWVELEDYSEATREEWLENAAASQIIDTATAAEFNINATVAIKGMFLVSNNTKGGTAGTLWATGGFSSVVNATSGDVLKVEYELSAAAS